MSSVTPTSSLDALCEGTRSLSTSPDSTTWSPSKKFIMVIGGLGYIGSHTAVLLLTEGFNIIIVDHLRYTSGSVLASIKKIAERNCKSTRSTMPDLHFHNMDYRSSDMMALLKFYDEKPARSAQSNIVAVIHLAAHKIVAESIVNPLAYYANNLSGLVDLLILLRKHNITRFIMSSSAAIYGARTNQADPLDEDLVVHCRQSSNNISPTELCSPYARTKQFAEAILADTAAADPLWNITTLRYFNPVGCHPSGLLVEDPGKCSSNLFAVIAQVLTRNRPYLEIFGSDWETKDGTAVRDFVHVLDVARGHVEAIKKGHSVGFRAYNLGSGRGTTVLDVISSVELLSTRKLPVKWAQRRPGDVGVCVASIGRAQEELGWEPTKKIETCIRDMLKSVHACHEGGQ